MLTLGAFSAWVGNAVIGLPLPAAAVLAAAVVAGACVASDILVFERLRDRGAMTLLVASMGVSLVIENICRLSFGNAPRNFDIDVGRPFRWNDLRITHEQLASAAVVILALVAFHMLLRSTPLGRAMRAVADNAMLAAVRGIERTTVARLMWVLAGTLTAVAGVLAGLDGAIDPLLGWTYLIPAFAAAILGGLGNPVGAVFGAITIGVVEELSTLVISSSYRQSISFVVILLLLLLRPEGLFGRRSRSA
jgi:branched-chain amino acid transport system permease protein